MYDNIESTLNEKQEQIQNYLNEKDKQYKQEQEIQANINLKERQLKELSENLKWCEETIFIKIICSKQTIIPIKIKVKK